MARDRLPPLAATRVFEAAARHKNFTAAAQELGMTQAAVSYQIKVLEERVGTALFIRQPRGVQLSDTGRRLSLRTSDAFDILAEAYADARGREEDTLIMSVITTFATNFLAQRLGRFQLANPSLAVRVDMSPALVDFASQDFDVAIRMGKGDWPGVICHHLLPADFTPMLSPELAESIGGIHEPSDLLKLALIQPTDKWWQDWFDAAGVSDANLAERTGVKFGPQILEANAAIAGQGVGILTPVFYRHEIAQKRLYQPFELTCNDGTAHWLIYPESKRNSPKIRAFQKWLDAEIAEFIA